MYKLMEVESDDEEYIGPFNSFEKLRGGGYKNFKKRA